MTKRIIALVMALITITAVFAACAAKDKNDKGAYISMYIADEVYDFDPANAYNNDSALKMASLLFSPLFALNDEGEVEKVLVDSYYTDDDKASGEYKLTLKLKTSHWSDGTQISANDIVFAWKRILEVESTSAAAPLLFDIKNARMVKAGDCSIDDLRVYAVNPTTLEIYFEEKLDENGNPCIDYDGFIRNLTSYALVPLREMIVSRTTDWAKAPGTMVCSGPFTIRKISYVDDETRGITLERNAYYMRDKEEDAIDEAVTPYRLMVDYSKSAEETLAAFNNGQLFYIGQIPFSLRSEYASKATVTDAMSTHTYYLNENAVINGEQLFANKAVRQALSMAIDRDAIAQKVVFAKAATGIVPNRVFNGSSADKDFRTAGGSLINTSADIDGAKALLKNAGIEASKYSFSIMVAAYDEAHVAMAEEVMKAWNALGFKVTLDKVHVKVNRDIGPSGDEEAAKKIRDDIFQEKFLRGEYEVAATDLVAYSPDAFGILAPFALGFSGEAMDMNLKDENGEPYYVTPVHATGYNNDEYTAIIEQAYAIGDADKKAAVLHNAESFLVDEMPIIPVVFNKDATLIRDSELSKVYTTYYGTKNFTKANLKDYYNYIPEEELAKMYPETEAVQ